MGSHIDRNQVRYVVPAGLLAESAEMLRSMSSEAQEAVLLWAGTQHASRVPVHRIIAPRQYTSRVHFEVTMQERIRIIRELAERGEVLVAQLHTHPGPAFHSTTDDHRALPRHTGAISIVVANFAEAWKGDLLDASINRHLGQGKWVELSPAQIAATIEVQ